jgi:prolyl-tRNA synthetase
MHKIYSDFANDVLLLPVFSGEKTVSERFAGASNSFTIETILKDGQALQSGTSHYLADKFSKAFDVKIQDENNKIYNPFQTS